MTHLSEEQGLIQISKLIGSVSEVRNAGRGSSEHNRWLLNTLALMKNIFGEDSIFYKSLDSFTWRETGSMIVHNAHNFNYEVSQRHNRAFEKQLEAARGVLLSAKDQMEGGEILQTSVFASKGTSKLIQVLSIGDSKLRKVIRAQPSSEREVQDNFENLLIGAEIKYAREHPHITYSAKQYVPDFSFPEYDLAVEIKLCKEAPKLLIAQINDDILAYKTVFNNIIFVVYDLGQIRDIETFKQSFERIENVFVQIVKH